LLLSVHPGITPEAVQENTGFALRIPAHVPETPLPAPDELRLLREEIDPRGVYLR
jgi:glutaconate CoA-transferase subunit B